MTCKTLPLKSCYILCFALATIGFVPAKTFAQTPAITPVFSPSGPWNVGATEFSNIRGLGDTKMPCVLSNEYDNGFIVRFSGGGQKMIAMAVDFRQDAFVRGRKYPAVLSVGSAYIKQLDATAFTNSTLIFNLRPLSEFYAVLQSQTAIALDIDGNEFNFDLGGLSAQINELESCYQGKKTKIIEPLFVAQNATVETAPSTPSEDLQTQNFPESHDDIVQERKSVLPQQKEAPKVSVRPAEPQNTWVAKAGEDMRVVLSRWANQAGYDFEWDAPQEAKIVSTVNLHGSFEDAVAQIMAESGVVNGVEARLNNNVVQETPLKMMQIFSAQKGDSLKDTLAAWSREARVTIDWDISGDFVIKSDVVGQGVFEQAVQMLLDQYEGDIIRPYGQLETTADGSGHKLTINNGQ